MVYMCVSTIGAEFSVCKFKLKSIDWCQWCRDLDKCHVIRWTDSLMYLEYITPDTCLINIIITKFWAQQLWHIFVAHVCHYFNCVINDQFLLYILMEWYGWNHMMHLTFTLMMHLMQPRKHDACIISTWYRYLQHKSSTSNESSIHLNLLSSDAKTICWCWSDLMSRMLSLLKSRILQISSNSWWSCSCNYKLMSV